MENQEEHIKEGYQKNFVPHEFLAFKLKDLRDEKTGNNYEFWYKCLHEFFSSEKVKAERLLDVGSGPTVYNVASASAYVPHIVLSELVEASRQDLQKWLNQDQDCLDWTPFLEIVAKVEGRKDLDTACKEIESRIRAAVKDVIPCNVLDEHVIPKEYREPPYDVVLTSLTLETAATSWESFSKMLMRIKSLLRPGGWLIMMALTNCKSWLVGNNLFPYFQMEVADIQRALETNGFSAIHWKFRESLPSDWKKPYFLTAKKP